MENKEQHTHIVDYKQNFLVWIDLLILTIVTVKIAQLDLGNFTVFVALTVASMKTWLVGTYFMHLKFENRFFKIMVGLVAVVFVALLILLFSDYSYR